MKINKHFLKLFLREHSDKLFATCSTCDCPVAHYVTSALPDAATVRVSVKHVSVRRYIAEQLTHECEPHSAWLKQFIERIDAYGMHSRVLSRVNEPAQISGAKALEILELIDDEK